MTHRLEFLFFETRILTALIAVTIALYYLHFFDSIFKLILENVLSFELSLPVNIYSFTLTLYFPSEKNQENKRGDDFFLLNKIEKEEKIINDEKVAIAVIQKTQMDNNLDITDEKNSNKSKEKKKKDTFTSTYAQFEKFRYLFIPMKSEKIFRNVPDVIKEDSSTGVASDTKKGKLLNRTNAEHSQSMNFFLEIRKFLRNLFNFSLFWDRFISLFLLLHSLRGSVILKNVRVLSPKKEIDARWLNETIVTAEKIKITFNFFRSLYYFLFSFTHLIVFDNAFIDGLTINIEGYEEKINATLNRIESSLDCKNLNLNEKGYITPEKEKKTEFKITTDKINNEINNLYKNVLTAITIKIPSPSISSDSQNIKKSIFSPPDTPIIKKNVNENSKSKLILNVSLFGKSIPIKTADDAIITSTSSSFSVPTSPTFPFFPFSFSPPLSPSSSSISTFPNTDNNNTILINNESANKMQNISSLSQTNTTSENKNKNNDNINYGKTILEENDLTDINEITAKMTHTICNKEINDNNSTNEIRGKKDNGEEKIEEKVENGNKNKDIEKREKINGKNLEKESPYNIFNSFLEQAKEQFNSDLQKLNKVDVFIQETAVTLKTKIKHQINEWKAEVTNFQEEVNKEQHILYASFYLYMYTGLILYFSFFSLFFAFLFVSVTLHLFFCFT